jgi:predicted PurR-regulated permease PerM
MNITLTNRGLLRAVFVAFILFLVYRFLATVAATVLLLGTGLLVAVALSAPVEALQRRRIPRPAAVALIVGGVLIVLAVGGYLLLSTLTEQASQLVSSLPRALSQLVERARGFAREIGFNIAAGRGGEGVSPQSLASVGRGVLGGALGLFSGLAAFLTGLIVVLFVPLYLTAMPGPVVRWVIRLFPPEKREEVRSLLSGAYTRLLGWLKGHLFSMVVIGLLSTLALYLIGVPGALFLGVFSGLVAFVPLIGSVVGAIPPLVLALADNPLDALWVLLAYVAIQQVESNLLTPLVMQRTVSLHPVVVIATVSVASAAFGVLGTLLAVPASVVAGVFVERLWFRRLEKKRRKYCGMMTGSFAWPDPYSGRVLGETVKAVRGSEMKRMGDLQIAEDMKAQRRRCVCHRGQTALPVRPFRRYRWCLWGEERRSTS